MPQRIDIQEYRFPVQSVNAATGSTVGVNSNYPLNGFLQRISWMSNIAGSIYILESGTNILLASSAVVSGTNGQEVYPRTPAVDSANVPLSGTAFGRWVDFRALNNNVLLIGSAFASGALGAANQFGPVAINYW